VLWLVSLEDFEAYLLGIGFFFVGGVEGHNLYKRGDTYLSIRCGEPAGPFPQTEMERACDAAGIDPPDLQQSFGAP
jgi:hypothetical protein